MCTHNNNNYYLLYVNVLYFYMELAGKRPARRLQPISVLGFWISEDLTQANI